MVWRWWVGLAGSVKKCDFWKVLGLARNPSKKMRLDESFRMVRVPCHLEVVVKSYGQITVWENVMGKWGRNVMDYIFGGIHWTPSKAVVISSHYFFSFLLCSIFKFEFRLLFAFAGHFVQ